MRYRSILGGGRRVDFRTAVLDGVAADGGLYVPEGLPVFSAGQLDEWKGCSFTELAQRVLRALIPVESVPDQDLNRLVSESFGTFFHPEVIPFHHLGEGLVVQELFHGPTLSFKDVAMGFVVNLFDHFLNESGERKTIMVATSGDTGPAAAAASLGKKSMSTWLLYPAGMISEEQRRQMSTLIAPNIHTVEVRHCTNGSDDLDSIIAAFFADRELRDEIRLSSVNSINWARVMTQTVHYFYAYLQVAERVGDPVHFSVPCGAFGNLCAGAIARRMGLPAGYFVAASNENGVITEAMNKGVLRRRKVLETLANAIDIAVPMNFWRCLYFTLGEDASLIRDLYHRYREDGEVQFDPGQHAAIRSGFLADSVSNERILDEMRVNFERSGYLLDPHGAVAVCAARKYRRQLEGSPTVCLATAHPAKFPGAVRMAVNQLPAQGLHYSIEQNKEKAERLILCDYKNAITSLPDVIRALI